MPNSIRRSIWGALVAALPLLFPYILFAGWTLFVGAGEATAGQIVRPPYRAANVVLCIPIVWAALGAIIFISTKCLSWLGWLSMPITRGAACAVSVILAIPIAMTDGEASFVERISELVLYSGLIGALFLFSTSLWWRLVGKPLRMLSHRRPSGSRSRAFSK